jgi:hypothetical protein
MRATLPRWLIGLTVAALLGGAPAGRAQSTAPALTACQLARLRSVPRWEFDYSYRYTNDYSASGEDGTIGGIFSFRDWTYTARSDKSFRLVVQGGRDERSHRMQSLRAPGSRDSHRQRARRLHLPRGQVLSGAARLRV